MRVNGRAAQTAINSYSLIFFFLLVLGQSHAVRNLQISSPIQALTIWDDKECQKDPVSTARGRFLPRFKAGVEAEARLAKEISANSRSAVVDSNSPNWARKAAAAERQAAQKEDTLLEEAFDRATAATLPKRLPNGLDEAKYQFVGVIGNSHNKNEKPITWYARKKPSSSRWTVRLVHANRSAILKDLFDQGAVDIFARYENTGKLNQETGLPIINSNYKIRERSWRNLWNFSPKHLFTDSSGMYWRERRLSPGLYTDGKTVYEASYRYRDGRNGMHRLSSFQQFLSSRSVDEQTKEGIQRRLKSDAPDVVLEE